MPIQITGKQDRVVMFLHELNRKDVPKLYKSAEVDWKWDKILNVGLPTLYLAK